MIRRDIAVAMGIGLVMGLSVGLLHAQSTPDRIFKDQFSGPPAPPILQLTGQAMKGPFIPGASLRLMVLNGLLRQTGPEFVGDVINDQGHFRVSAEIPAGPILLTLTGHYLDERTNQMSTEPITLQAVSMAQETVHINLLTHLATQRIRTLRDSPMPLMEAKAQALNELLTALGFEVAAEPTIEVATAINWQEVTPSSIEHQALMALTLMALTDETGQPRSGGALQAWLTVLREDFSDGQLTDARQQAIARSARAALSDSATFESHLEAALSPTPDLPDGMSALTQTLRALAHRVHVTTTAGGSSDVSGGTWLVGDETLSIGLSPELGHIVQVVNSSCGGVLNEGNTQFSVPAINSDCTIEVEFTKNTYPVTVVMSQGGTHEPAGPLSVLHGDSLALSLTAPEGLDGITASGCGGQLVNSTYTTGPISGACTVTVSFYAPFYLDDNGYTIRCPEASVGDVGMVGEVMYTKRSADQITPTHASTTCISGVSDLSGVFENATDFNGDISHWDTAGVTQMDRLFSGASVFNQDLRQWCVAHISTPPVDFERDAIGWDVSQPRPSWGQDCGLVSESRTLTVTAEGSGHVSLLGETELAFGDRQALTITPDPGHRLVSVSGCDGVLIQAVYTTANVITDCTVTVVFGDFYLADNGITVMCPNASVGDSELLDGVVYTKRDRDSITAANAQTTCTSGITDLSTLWEGQSDFNVAIGHWDTSSVTTMVELFKNAGQFNQALDGWDVSQVTNMNAMFQGAMQFNQDLSSWDTQSVTTVDYMFYNAGTFNQDLSAWCVEQITGTVWGFDFGATQWTAPKPQFGTPCSP